MLSPLVLYVKSHIIHNYSFKVFWCVPSQNYIIINISSFLRYWRVLRVSMLRHFSISSRRISSGFFKEIVIVDTMSVHGENLYFEGEGTITLLYYDILDIKSKSSIYVICFNCMF